MFATKVGLFLFLNAVDLISAVIFYNKVGATFELNPVARLILTQSGLMGAITMKLVAVGLCLTVSAFLAIRHEKKAHMALNVFIYISLFGAMLSLMSFF